MIPTTACIVEAAREGVIPMLVEKGRSAIERPFPKIRLTDKEYGQNGFQYAVPKRREKIKGRQPIGPSPRYDGGKAYDCHRERGSVAFGERQADKKG